MTVEITEFLATRIISQCILCRTNWIPADDFFRSGSLALVTRYYKCNKNTENTKAGGWGGWRDRGNLKMLR